MPSTKAMNKLLLAGHTPPPAAPVKLVNVSSREKSSGAGAKIRRRRPDGFEAAGTRSWSGEAHFLLVTVDGDRLTVRAIGESPDDALTDIPRATPSEVQNDTLWASVPPGIVYKGTVRMRFSAM